MSTNADTEISSSQSTGSKDLSKRREAVLEESEKKKLECQTQCDPTLKNPSEKVADQDDEVDNTKVSHEINKYEEYIRVM